MLRRALLLWGTGHLAQGDRRGWLLLALQPLAIAGVALLASLLIDTTRWLAVLLALVALVALWLGQAVHAYVGARRAGGAAGGELQVVVVLPLVVVVVGGFWMLAGEYGSPGATLQRYVSAWQSDSPQAAASLFSEQPDPALLASDWQAQHGYLVELVDAGFREYGAQSGLDPQAPFSSLRFEELAAERQSGRAVVAIDLVRRERFQTQVLGLIPTAAQRTVLVRRLGLVRLHVEPAPSPWWLPGGIVNPGRIWRIDEVAVSVER
ncbi:MAG TPA: hypothetical protein VH741_08960 [Candidatus Limnocylindrales bacterium]